LRRFHIVLGLWLAGVMPAPWAVCGEMPASNSADATEQAAQAALDEISEQQSKLKSERFEVLVERTKAFLNEQRYDQALVTAEAALEIFPEDSTAAFLRDKAIRDAGATRDVMLQNARRRETEQAMDDIETAMTVPHTVVTYPDAKSWGEVIRRSTRESRGVTGPVVSAWEDKLREQLKQRVSFSFDDQSLPDVMKFLSDTTGVGIVMDPQAVIGNNSLTLELDGVRFESALHQICRLADVKWSMADTMIYISDTAVLDEPEITTYDVSDLLTPNNFNTLKDLNVSVTYDERFHENAAQDIRGRELVDFITRAVAPGTWDTSGERERGRGRNSIQYRQGRLVISGPPEIQKQVARLLGNFRKARTVQVMISTRFIDIEQNYLEEIGVDWTGLEGETNQIYPYSQYTRTDGAGNPVPIARGFSARGRSALDEFGNPRYRGYPDSDDPAEAYRGLPLPGESPADGWGRHPEPTYVDVDGDGVFTPGVDIEGKRPGGPWDVGMANVNYLGVPLGDPTQNFTRDGGLSLDLAYLGRYQVRALLEAVVKHRKGNILTSPRLTCYNGQRANIAVATQINYMRTISEGIPEIASLTDGIVFEVVPYVSADRRYVTMELQPTLRQVQTIDQEAIEIVDQATAARLETWISLPTVVVKSVETFASVPDGGTLLLGGLSRAVEREGRAGVPILNRIPVLKFFFSRWGKSDVRSSLIVLVRADVLLQGEKEPAVGPPN